MGCIYLIKNNKDTKCYVGQTINDPIKRWRAHKSRPNKYLGRAFKAHGIENFTFSILHKVPDDELDDLEIREISERNTLAPNGYNFRKGGEGGGHLHEESKRKISIARTGKKLPPFTEEHRRNLSESLKGKYHPNNRQVGISKYNLDGTFIESYKTIRSAARSVDGHHELIRKACMLIMNSYKDFIWKFTQSDGTV